MTEFFNNSMEFLPSLLSATVITLKIFILTAALSLILGVPLGVFRNSKIRIVRFFIWVYIGIFRGTPLLLQLFFFYFFLPDIIGVYLDAFEAVVVAFTLNYAAYFAEIYRGGINSIDSGQFEAAYTLGISKFKMYKDIIFPQAMRGVIPAIFNEIIVLIKDTALASVLPIMELMKATNSAVSRTSKVEPFLLAAIIYLLITFVVTVIGNRIEKRYAIFNEKEA